MSEARGDLMGLPPKDALTGEEGASDDKASAPAMRDFEEAKVSLFGNPPTLPSSRVKACTSAGCTGKEQ